MIDWRVFQAVYRRTCLGVARRKVILLLSFVQPLIWMCFFGFLFQRFPLGEFPDNIRYLDFLVPGICVMTVLIGGSQSGIGFIRDIQSDFLQRMVCTPASCLSILLGKVCGDVTRLIVQAVLVAMLGLALGARFQLEPNGLILAIIGVALFGAFYCGLSCWISLKTRRQESMASFIHLANMPIFFTSTALVPTKQMPFWLQSLATWNPLSIALEPLRSSLLFKTLSTHLWAIACLACLSIATLSLAYSQLKMQFRQAS